MITEMTKLFGPQDIALIGAAVSFFLGVAGLFCAVLYFMLPFFVFSMNAKLRILTDATLSIQKHLGARDYRQVAAAELAAKWKAVEREREATKASGK